MAPRGLSRWVLRLLPLALLAWSCAVVWVLERGPLHGAPLAQRVLFFRRALLPLCGALAAACAASAPELLRRLRGLVDAEADDRDVALLRLGLGAQAYLMVDHWCWGLSGSEGVEVFDCGEDFCYPLEFWSPSPTWRRVSRALMLPAPSMFLYRLARRAVVAGSALFAAGLLARPAALATALALLYHQSIRVHWSPGEKRGIHVPDQHLPILLLFFAVGPASPGSSWSLGAALGLAEPPKGKRSSAALHLAIAAYLGCCYGTSGVCKLWHSGLDWIMNAAVLRSIVDQVSNCSGGTEGAPAAAAVAAAPAFLRLAAAGTIAFELGVFPVLLLCPGPWGRLALCAVGWSFHAGVGLSTGISFWAFQLTWLALVEWHGLAARWRATVPSRSPAAGGRRALLPLAAALAVCGSLTVYHGYLLDNGEDFPFSSYPPFPGEIALPVETLNACAPGWSLWSLRLALDPPLAGFRELDTYEDLIPRPTVYYMSVGQVVERAVLRSPVDEARALGALRLLLNQLRFRMDRTWSGASVEVSVRARFNYRGANESIGRIRSYEVQRYSVRPRACGRLFSRPSGLRELSVAAGHGGGEPWEMLVCGSPPGNASRRSLFLPGLNVLAQGLECRERPALPDYGPPPVETWAAGSPACWQEGFSPADCCVPPSGNPGCWLPPRYTFEVCCAGVDAPGAAAPG